MLPFNITLFQPTPAQLRTIRPVTTLDIFDGPGGNFHDDGLFSTVTFGRLGDPLRDRRFGYIHLRIPVFHPVVYTRLVRLKGLYRGILAGTEYATWDSTLKDFVKSNELEGRTGYSFFVQYWNELTPAKTGSDIRDLRIALIDKYRDAALLTDLLVLPAGLRDVEIGGDGRATMDEVNELYQSVLMLVRNFPERLTQADTTIYDRTRYTLTMKIVEIYEHFERLISGKNGFIQSKYASRRVFNGTRNVISSLDTSAVDLDAPNRPKANDTVIGLYQASKALLPKVVYGLKTGIIGEIFNTASNNIELVNPKTLQLEWTEVSSETMDRWSTPEGLEKIVNELSIVEKRDRPVMIEDRYLALVYVDDKANYRVFRDLREFPSEFNRSFVRPITYVELIYLSALSSWYSNTALVTRFPVENAMSSYPTSLYVKTTVQGELRYELDGDWNRKGDEYRALEYPIIKDGVVTNYHDSTSVNPSRLSSLGADFDGDTVSLTATYSKEANEEAKRYFKSRAFYVRPAGGLNFSADIHTVGLVLGFMTR